MKDEFTAWYDRTEYASCPSRVIKDAARDAWHAATEKANAAYQWQPMSDAPMDGRKVLLNWPFWSNECVIGSYTNKGWWANCVLTGDGDGPIGWQPLPATAPV